LGRRQSLCVGNELCKRINGVIKQVHDTALQDDLLTTDAKSLHDQAHCNDLATLHPAVMKFFSYYKLSNSDNQSSHTLTNNMKNINCN